MQQAFRPTHQNGVFLVCFLGHAAAPSDSKLSKLLGRGSGLHVWLRQGEACQTTSPGFDAVSGLIC
jgi:hypothetical protein